MCYGNIELTAPQTNDTTTSPSRPVPDMPQQQQEQDSAAPIPTIPLQDQPAVGPTSTMPETLPWRDAQDDLDCGVAGTTETPRLPLRDTFLASLVAELEDVDVYLPSLYHSRIRNHPAMEPAVAIERKLREGEAHDCLNDVRLHITARHSLQGLEAQGAGQAHGKRVREMEATQDRHVSKAREEYNRIRRILLVLDMGKLNPTFRELTDADCHAVAEPRKRGESRTTRSWLWADLAILGKDLDAGVKEFMVQSEIATHTSGKI